MAQSKSKNMALTFVDDMLRGAGQVMFQNNAWTGLLFFCGIFWGAYETDNIAVARASRSRRLPAAYSATPLSTDGRDCGASTAYSSAAHFPRS